MRPLIALLTLTLLIPGCSRRPTLSSDPLGLPTSSQTVKSSKRVESGFKGKASYYADPYHGRPTASGEIFDKNKVTAAHRTLPFNTWVRVENMLNGKAVEVRINDRGPFVSGRVIDLSLGAAKKIDMVRAGVVPVVLKVIKEAPTADKLRSKGQDVFYVIQLGAFENEAAAQNLRRRIEKKYTGVYVEKTKSGEKLYKVRIGRALLREARRIQRLLKDDDIESIVIQMR